MEIDWRGTLAANPARFPRGDRAMKVRDNIATFRVFHFSQFPTNESSDH